MQATMITGMVVTIEEELDSIGYLAKSDKATPLVQPNPSYRNIVISI